MTSILDFTSFLSIPACENILFQNIKPPYASGFRRALCKTGFRKSKLPKNNIINFTFWGASSWFEFIVDTLCIIKVALRRVVATFGVANMISFRSRSFTLFSTICIEKSQLKIMQKINGLSFQSCHLKVTEERFATVTFRGMGLHKA